MKKRFVNLPVSFLILLFFALCAAAQNSPECALTNAPRLNGLTLGMTSTEVRAVFGKNPSIKVKANGDRTFFQNYIGKKKAPASLSGVSAFYLRFLDGKLYQIEIFYAENPAVPTLRSFTTNLSAQMNLPPETNWNFAQNKASIDCGNFTIVADKPVNPRVELTDKSTFAEAEARRKKKS